LQRQQRPPSPSTARHSTPAPPAMQAASPVRLLAGSPRARAKARADGEVDAGAPRRLPPRRPPSSAYLPPESSSEDDEDDFPYEAPIIPLPERLVEKVTPPAFDPALSKLRAIDPRLAAQLQARMRQVTIQTRLVVATPPPSPPPSSVHDWEDPLPEAADDAATTPRWTALRPDATVAAACCRLLSMSCPSDPWSYVRAAFAPAVVGSRVLRGESCSVSSVRSE
jgi:hypothetical protein